MTRQFKKEIVEEATACIRGNMRDGACSYEGVALALMRILADHGALSEEAYEPAPKFIWVTKRRDVIVRGPGDLQRLEELAGPRVLLYEPSDKENWWKCEVKE